MTTSELIIERLIGNIEERGSGVYVKHLRNGDVYTCKCPNCKTFHGGYSSFGEAKAYLKCKTCFRNEIEKEKKEIEKVDKPKKQKNIFQHPLNKPSVLGESDDFDDLGDMKDMAGAPVEDPRYAPYHLDDKREEMESSLATTSGLLGRAKYPDSEQNFKPDWRIVGLKFQREATRHTPWPEIMRRLDDGESLEGYPVVYNRGEYIVWDRIYTLYKWRVNESDEDDLDMKELMGNPPDQGIVTKEECVNAHYGQEFYSRSERDRKGYPSRVRVSGKCKTWKTRPNEFKLPVKFGLYQSLYITNYNAGEFSTIPLDSRGQPL